MSRGDVEALVTVAEAARAIGINKSTLSRQVKAGLVRSHDGKVLISEAIEDRARHVDASRAHRRQASTDDDTAAISEDLPRPEAEPVASRVAPVARRDATQPDATLDATRAIGDLITVAEAAREVGVNKSTLTRQVRSGAVRSHGGKVRLTEVLEDRARNIDLTKAKPGTATRSAKGASTKSTSSNQAGDMLVEVDGEYLTLAEAQRLKENYLAKLRKLEFDSKSSLVVGLEAAEKVFFDTGRELRDAWLGWPPRVSTIMAAELGVDERLLTEILMQHVHQHLAELGEPEAPDFAAAS